MTSIKAYSVGIGITTYNRPDMLEKCLEHIYKHTNNTYQLYVAVDKDDDRQGISKRKNECLRVLKDCDHIFLLDDDCYPVKDGWVDFFVSSGYNHLLYLNQSHNYMKTINGNAKVYRDCGGVFMYMTKECIKDVGAFNEKFEIFGFEHADYSQRVYKAGLTVAPYICLNGTSEYIYSEDYSNPNHKSSLSIEEKNKHIKNNWNKFFNKEIKSIYLPL